MYIYGRVPIRPVANVSLGGHLYAGLSPTYICASGVRVGSFTLPYPPAPENFTPDLYADLRIRAQLQIRAEGAKTYINTMVLVAEGTEMPLNQDLYAEAIPRANVEKTFPDGKIIV